MLSNLSNKNIILASKSPRRQQLLKGLDIDFEIRTKEIEEIYPPELPIFEVPEYLAKLKATAFQNDLQENDLLITSDTVVILKNQILEKPAGRDEAIQMIQLLSGNTHTVVTGVCLTTKDKQLSFSDQTKVTFKALTEEEIVYYIDHYQPFDKAGSYGCQEWIGYVAIDRLEGSFYSVMGLPLHRLYDYLKKF